LPATDGDVLHGDLSASSAGADVTRFLARVAIRCHFFAIWTSLLALTMVASPAFSLATKGFRELRIASDDVQLLLAVVLGLLMD
jgi:hypothetical protein